MMTLGQAWFLGWCLQCVPSQCKNTRPKRLQFLPHFGASSSIELTIKPWRLTSMRNVLLVQSLVLPIALADLHTFLAYVDSLSQYFPLNKELLTQCKLFFNQLTRSQDLDVGQLMLSLLEMWDDVPNLQWHFSPCNHYTRRNCTYL